jgi:hypothetical protein
LRGALEEFGEHLLLRLLVHARDLVHIPPQQLVL